MPGLQLIPFLSYSGKTNRGWRVKLKKSTHGCFLKEFGNIFFIYSVLGVSVLNEVYVEVFSHGNNPENCSEKYENTINP